MRMLYHMWLSPGCRQIRVLLAEKGLSAELKTEKVWERRTEFLKLNPAGEVPVLVERGEGGDTILAHTSAIAEYLEEAHPEPALMPKAAAERAEVRRLVQWFDGKCAREVSDPLVAEQVMKRFLGLGQPNSDAIRSAHKNLKTHLAYIAFLIERRNYLAGPSPSLADIAAAAHISVLDYLANIDWVGHPVAKEWYVRVKSRKSFRAVLKDRIPGLAPPAHYDKLDF